MLLDLGRNDVGRVAKAGTVRVTEREIIERYSHVMHIVSNVEGELGEGEDAISALMAGFPAGTVSGAPKVRAMEIIDELEPHRRGIYAGAVGYFGANGDMDMAIALRTAIVKDGRMHVQAGAGSCSIPIQSPSIRKRSTRPAPCSGPHPKPGVSSSSRFRKTRSRSAPGRSRAPHRPPRRDASGRRARPESAALDGQWRSPDRSEARARVQD